MPWGAKTQSSESYSGRRIQRNAGLMKHAITQIAGHGKHEKNSRKAQLHLTANPLLDAGEPRILGFKR